MELDEFIGKTYRVVLSPISPEDGGGWLAEVPDLPGCMSDGVTVEEALSSLQDAKKAWFFVAKKRGQAIPDPTAPVEEFSGKFTLRLPKSLHRELSLAAEREGISLNQYVLSLISFGFGKQSTPVMSEHPTAPQYYITVHNHQAEPGFEDTSQDISRLLRLSVPARSLWAPIEKHNRD